MAPGEVSHTHTSSAVQMDAIARSQQKYENYFTFHKANVLIEPSSSAS